MELVRKLQELIKEVQKYVEEQAKAHKKVRRVLKCYMLPKHEQLHENAAKIKYSIKPKKNI